MTQALIIVDIQNDYFPGGAMELVGSVEASRVASEVLGHFRQQALPVIHVQHVATSAGATFFLPGTQGAEIHESVAPRADEPVVVKHHPNSFLNTDLLDRLKALDVKEVMVIGMMTHMCVDSTVRAASDYGFTVTVYENACATTHQTFNGKTTKAEDVQVAFLAALESFATIETYNP